MTPEERLTRVETLLTERERVIEEMREDVREIRQTLAEARGGWKTLVLVGGAAGAAGAILGKVAAVFGVVKP